jgi:glycerol-3-phosphate acyltransferase PlsY
MTILDLLLVLAAYLIGSIPSSVWIGKMLRGVDVRAHGSKNAGATNTMRVLGVKIGIPVLLIDILKGFAAVKLVLCSSFLYNDTDTYIKFQLLLGMVAVLGHVFPVFAGFRGGKGVASVVGVLLALYWPATVLSIGVFLLSLCICKYVSLSSLIMGVSYPISVIFIFTSEKTNSIYLEIFSIAVCLLLFVTHWKNIARLLKGEERKATFLFGNAKKSVNTH